MSCEGQFVAELIAFASTSLGATKVRAAAISIPGFAAQEQENKTRGLRLNLPPIRQIEIDDRLNLDIRASINTVQVYQGLIFTLVNA